MIGITCPECGGVIKFDDIAGDIVCVKCGYVMQDRYATLSPSGDEFMGEKARVGLPLTHRLHDYGMGTTPAEMQQERKSEKLLQRILGELHWVASKLKLSAEVEEIAAKICRNAVKKKAINRSSRAAAVAVIYIALKAVGMGRTLYDLSLACNTPLKPLARQVRRLMVKLQMKPLVDDPEKMVSVVLKRLDLPSDLEIEAIDVIKVMRKIGLSQGRKPQAVSAAAVYIVCKRKGIRISMSRISSEMGISEPTLRKLIRTVFQHNNNKKK